MTRDTAREIAVQMVFGVFHSGAEAEDFFEEFLSEEHISSLGNESVLYSEAPEGRSLEYIRAVFFGVLEHQEEIDDLIRRYSSSSWDIRRFSGTALAVLRVAVFEILYLEDVPVGSAINSAVEIDKGYDDPEVVAFVNGILGGFVRGEGKA